MKIACYSEPARAWLRAFGFTADEFAETEGAPVAPSEAPIDLIVRSDENLNGLPQTVSEVVFAPKTFKQAVDAALRLARATGRLPQAMAWIASAERRLAEARGNLGLSKRAHPDALPTVVCLLQTSPPVVAGWWGPDVIELAGGRPLIVAAGSPPRETSWEAVREATADVLVIAEGCAPEGIKDIRRVLCLGPSFLQMPGPDLYTDAIQLATLLHENAGLPNERKAGADR